MPFGITSDGTPWRASSNFMYLLTAVIAAARRSAEKSTRSQP